MNHGEMGPSGKVRGVFSLLHKSDLRTGLANWINCPRLCWLSQVDLFSLTRSKDFFDRSLHHAAGTRVSETEDSTCLCH